MAEAQEDDEEEVEEEVEEQTEHLPRQPADAEGAHTEDLADRDEQVDVRVDKKESEVSAATAPAHKPPKVGDPRAHFSMTDNEWVWNKPGHEDKIIDDLKEHLITLYRTCKVGDEESGADITPKPV